MKTIKQLAELCEQSTTDTEFNASASLLALRYIRHSGGICFDEWLTMHGVSIHDANNLYDEIGNRFPE